MFSSEGGGLMPAPSRVRGHIRGTEIASQRHVKEPHGHGLTFSVNP